MEAKYMQILRCIKDRNGRVCAWLVGMSDEEAQDYLKNHKGTYLSVERLDRNGYRLGEA